MTQIENDRKALEEAKGMAEEQRKKAEEELKKKEEKIQAADEEQRLLAQRWAGSLQKFFCGQEQVSSWKKKDSLITYHNISHSGLKSIERNHVALAYGIHLGHFGQIGQIMKQETVFFLGRLDVTWLYIPWKMYGWVSFAKVLHNES